MMKVKQMGFTLVELMIAVAIVGIFASISYPSYQSHIMKAKRSEAQAALVSMATAMEQWRVENNNSYCGSGTDTDCPTLSVSEIFAVQVPINGGTKTYDLSFDAAPMKTFYKLKAIPFFYDSCGNLTLDSTGIKASSTGTNCWE
ncbi:MAG: hypothetical protein RL236_709 [Pseudomonadota bacterium]|jgi:type IV pilus assembly protein PilE